MKSPERLQVANQIRDARAMERGIDDKYKTHRSGKEYFYRMGGLEHLFNYLKGLSSRKVLDVGAGTGNASRVVSEMPISSGLDFEVTVLQSSPELEKNFPKGKVHITGVETLRGIADESIAGVIGVNSMAYSLSPELAVKRIDEVLVPGGVLKATFAIFGRKQVFKDNIVFQDPEKFIHSLNELSYDVSFVQSHDFWTSEGIDILSNSILLAIKPGNPSAPSAEKLLHSDLEDMKSKASEKTSLFGLPVFDIED